VAAITGQPAPKPQSLSKPTPGAEAQATADDFLASFDQSDAPALAGSPAPVEAAATADDFMAGLDSAEVAPPPDEFAPEPGFIQANLEQLNPQNFVTRLQAGLAANDTEKEGFLKKKYGDENVRNKDGKLFYRKPGEKAFKKLDPDTFELISDIIPDFARELVTEAALLPSEIAGGIAGSAVPVAGTTAGVVAGRVATIPFANQVANDVARRAGVPQDQNRDQYMENNIAAGAEALLPVVGKTIAKPIAKRIPGTAAYKEAKNLAERELVALSKGSREVVDAAAALEREGINTPLMLQQIQPDSPKVKALADTVADSGQFINKQREFAEGYGQQLESNLLEIARRSGKGPVAPEKLASTITNAVESLERAEGEAIGKFRNKALANLKNQKQQLPAEVSEDVLGIMKELGFTPKRVKSTSVTRPGTVEGLAQRGFRAKNTVERVEWTPPKDLQPIIGRLGLDDSQTRSVVNVLNEYGQLMSRGNEARLTDVERLIKRMGPLNKKLGNSGLSGTWGKLTGNLRQHRRDIIGNSLGDEFEKQTFNNVMDEFSLLRQNTDQLSSVLRGDVTAKTVVNGFFKGKENLANIRALKSITGADSPEWGALKSEFMDQMMRKHANDGPTGFNSKGFLDDIEKNYGSDFIKEVLNDGKTGPNYDTIKNLLVVGKRIEATQKGIVADQASEKVKQGLFNGLAGFLGGMKFKMFNGLQSIIGASGNKESALMEILNRDGFDKYIANYRGPGNKKDIAEKMQGVLAEYNKTRQAVKTAAEFGKRGAKASARQDATEGKLPAVELFK